MDLLCRLKAENETLKSKVEQLEKLNNWYVEQLKLRQKEKFGKSSEQADENQISLFDLFNEAETLQQPFVKEPGEEIFVKEHKKRNAKRGAGLSTLPPGTGIWAFRGTNKPAKSIRLGSKSGWVVKAAGEIAKKAAAYRASFTCRRNHT